MPVLPALLVATTLFGFSLTPPVLEPIVLEIGVVGATQEAAAAPDVVTEPSPEVATPDAAAQAAAQAEEDHYVAEMKRRVQLARVHRVLGISTWVSYTATLVLGAIRYSDRYGFFASRDDNPCVRGTAVMGTDGCIGAPWYHVAGAITTSSLYSATFALSLFMPDPDHAAEGDSASASRMRTHKVLRWVHLGAMIAQLVLGPIISAVGDRTNDYRLQQALATTHLGIGFIGYGALTWAGALMVF